MTRLLPSNFDPELARVEEVFESRLEDIDLATLLIYLLDGGPEAALGELGWQFRALDQLWNSATDEQRVEYLRSIIARRRKKGTLWAVEQALAAIGFPDTLLHVRPSAKLYATGDLYADGKFYASRGSQFIWWLVVVGPALSPDEMVKVVNAFETWKRKSVHLSAQPFFYVASASNVNDPSQYERLS